MQSPSLYRGARDSCLGHFLQIDAVLGIPPMLGDIRNLCDHGKTAEPTLDQVNDPVAGVTKVTKTIF